MSFLVLIDPEVNRLVHYHIHYNTSFNKGLGAVGYKSTYKITPFPCMFKYFIKEKGNFITEHDPYSIDLKIRLLVRLPIRYKFTLPYSGLYDFFNYYVD